MKCILRTSTHRIETLQENKDCLCFSEDVKSNGSKGRQHSSGHIIDFIGIKGLAAVGVYVEEGRGNRDAPDACILCRF
ncbi:hypothetical protein TNIN_452921 [Trichonephila inaurata madagascariensis]|uniref:Uncharacterized protein n=1 Tax=Trichonephila inaurata madagascariensis TaxID=2747483 RepID=A0A8X6YDQ6_9ARAC|nr:hypothetical protein TNIN_452921 [Trichonephila inaurata madagascariensis]